MRDLVSRKAVLELLQGSDTPGHKPSALREMVERLPAADAAPVVHGRWETTENGYLFCTHCSWVRHGIPLIEHFSYCPNCGAKMDGAPDG